jgi:hypothetical protein
MGGNHGMPMDMSQGHMGAMDDLLSSLFGFPMQGQGFPPGMQGMPPAFHMQGQPGFPSGFGPNVRVFSRAIGSSPWDHRDACRLARHCGREQASRVLIARQ